MRRVVTAIISRVLPQIHGYRPEPGDSCGSRTRFCTGFATPFVNIESPWIYREALTPAEPSSKAVCSGLIVRKLPKWVRKRSTTSSPRPEARDYSLPTSFDLSKERLNKTIDIGYNGISVSSEPYGGVSAPLPLQDEKKAISAH